MSLATCFIFLIALGCPLAKALNKVNRKSSLTLERNKFNVNKSSPNIVWILADDLHYEPGILDNYPALRRIKDEGLEFVNHVSQSPLCGPSRASLIVGRLPHNSGYRQNADVTSLENFKKVHPNHVGKWLTDAGYYTAFLGKYVNGLEYTLDSVPKGWNYFGGFTGQWDPFKKAWIGGGYNFYNASQWDLTYDDKGEKLVKKNNSDYPILFWTDVHQADFLATQTLEQAQVAVEKKKPFFIFTNPVMVHHGTCQGPQASPEDFADDDPYWEGKMGIDISPCTKKRKNRMDFYKSYTNSFVMHEHSPSWNVSAIGQAKPPWGDCCSEKYMVRATYGRQNRTGSMIDLDEMIGVIYHGLAKMSVLDNTYIIFTSDNGFHLGEHQMSFGKTMPYDTDVHVPMVIRTPHGTSGVRHLPTSHVDITRTLVDIAQASSYVKQLDQLDGKSFFAAFHRDVKVTDWRRFSYSEMFEDRGKTWRNIRFMDEQGQPEWTLSLWCGGKVEIYHVGKDDYYQLTNVLDSQVDNESQKYGNEILDEWLPVINGMGTCKGEVCSSHLRTSKPLGGKATSELFDCMEARHRKNDLMKSWYQPSRSAHIYEEV